MCGEIITKFFIDPIHRQSEVIGEVADALIFYAREYSSPGYTKEENQEAAHERFRVLSSNLRVVSYRIKPYRFFERLHVVLRFEHIEKAATELIGLSNSVFPSSANKGDHNYDRVIKIRKLLGIPESN